jgi:PAS domain S-box-containing protein
MTTSAFSRNLTWPVIVKYAIAVVSVAISVVAASPVTMSSGADATLLLYLAAVTFVALAAGPGPAALAAALIFLALQYPPLAPAPYVLQLGEIVRLCVFVAASALVVSLSARRMGASRALQLQLDQRQAMIAELERQNETLRVDNVAHKEELQLIIDTIPVLVLRHRADGIIDFVNEVGRTYSGLTTTRWTSRTSRITHPDDVPQLEAAWDVALRTGEAFESEVRLRRADGEYRWFATRRVPLRRNGEVIAWYAATYDIEDRKRAESELIESERRLREAQMELAHASRVVTMGQFTASIAHEVNQPLSALLTNADTALRWLGHQPPNLERARPLIERVIGDGKRATDIVDRIRDLSRKAPRRRESLDVNETIMEIVKLARSVMSDNGILVKMQLSDRLPCVLGDKVQLQQVILNLIMNAVEAMGEVSEGSRELQIHSREGEPGNLIVAVRDSGPGLPPADTARLFEAFYTTKSTGLGIGLSICRSIVESHGGRLWAASNEPAGAVFSMTLPTEERVPTT